MCVRMGEKSRRAQFLLRRLRTFVFALDIPFWPSRRLYPSARGRQLGRLWRWRGLARVRRRLALPARHKSRDDGAAGFDKNVQQGEASRHLHRSGIVDRGYLSRICAKSRLSLCFFARALLRGPVVVPPCRGWPFPDKASAKFLRLGRGCASVAFPPRGAIRRRSCPRSRQGDEPTPASPPPAAGRLHGRL
jgi:hypothetical protein